MSSPSSSVTADRTLADALPSAVLDSPAGVVTGAGGAIRADQAT